VAGAAAWVWLRPPGHHLGSLASLGPLFNPRQQQRICCVLYSSCWCGTMQMQQLRMQHCSCWSHS
jgi:hypothetical protein